MKKSILLIFTIFIMINCTDDRLKKGTPLYELAKELSQKVLELDPDSNMVWISTDDFELRPSDIVPLMQERYGNRINSLKQGSSAQVRQSLISLSRMIARNRILLKAAKLKDINYSQVKFDSLMELQISKWGGPDHFKENFEKDGMKVEAIAETIKEGLIIDEYMKTAIPDSLLAVSDDEIKMYYNNKSVSVRHILLLTQGKTEEEKVQIHQKMEGILSQARSGEDFAQLAMTYSEDPGSKSKGGFYEFGPGQMVPEFEHASFTVPVGEISDIVETAYGYHIIQIIDRKPETRPIEQVRARYEAGLSRMKGERSRNIYIEELKERSNYKEYIS
jgi:peptidyl-prolyl cis-trans isomerase C